MFEKVRGLCWFDWGLILLSASVCSFQGASTGAALHNVIQNMENSGRFARGGKPKGRLFDPSTSDPNLDSALRMAFKVVKPVSSLSVDWRLCCPLVSNTNLVCNLPGADCVGFHAERHYAASWIHRSLPTPNGVISRILVIYQSLTRTVKERVCV